MKMTYGRGDCAGQLRDLVGAKKSRKEIADWAFKMKLWWKISGSWDDLLMRLVYMDEGPEFELSEEEMLGIATLIESVSEEAEWAG